MWHAALQALHYGYDASTVTLTTGPLYHVGALENVTSACLFVHGHALLTPSGNFDSAAVLQDIERHGVTDLFAFPFMVSDVLHNRRAQNHDLSSLRRVICGGTGTPSWAARETERQMPGAKLLLGYGMTESGTNATIDPALGLRTADPVDAIGIPLAGYEVQVRNLEGSECEPGVDGEIFVRGPSVCIGYWRDEEATERTFGDGWCRTGDLGQVTDGLLRITGRVKDMIRTGGENVYPAEVEAVLTVHKDILEAAVIGIPDARLEEAVCAVVLRREGATITDVEVIDFVRDRLAGYKKPRHVVFVDDLPRNPSGKVLKYMLRDRYASLGAGPVPVPAVEAEGDR